MKVALLCLSLAPVVRGLGVQQQQTYHRLSTELQYRHFHDHNHDVLDSAASVFEDKLQKLLLEFEKDRMELDALNPDEFAEFATTIRGCAEAFGITADRGSGAVSFRARCTPRMPEVDFKPT